MVGLLHRPGGEGKLKEEEEERGLEQKSFKVKREGMGRKCLGGEEDRSEEEREEEQQQQQVPECGGWNGGKRRGVKSKGGSSLSFAQKRGGKWMGWKTPSIPRRG